MKADSGGVSYITKNAAHDRKPHLLPVVIQRFSFSYWFYTTSSL